MITEEESNLLMQTGKGTPCGDLMRRYWQPCALSDELGVDKPLPVTIFGEEMILFRDGAGKPALIGRYCAHQGVDMIYGRVEPDGLRCMYHGWLFDQCGKVLLRGEWLPEKERRWDVGQPSYPVTEAGGIIFTYMGKDEGPRLPMLDFLTEDRLQAVPIKVLLEANYFQKMRETAHGQSFLMPNTILSQNGSAAAELCWHVPVDDQSHAQYKLSLANSSAAGGEPAGAAASILLEAVRKLSSEPPPTV